MNAAEIRLDELSPAKQELLQRRLGRLAKTRPARRPRPDRLPLSFAQERLWFLNRLEPDEAGYNLSAAHRLVGPLDERTLERTLREVVRRHEILRTTFPEADGVPRQRIADPSTLREPRLRVIDLSAIAPPRRLGAARGAAAALAARPFDLGRGPLLRAAAVRLAPDERVLVLALHHIVADGWSMRILMSELVTIYRAFAAGSQASPLPELRFQYADFALEQRRLDDAALDADLAYWRTRLAGIPELLELPADRPRPAVRTWRGGRVPIRFSARRTTALRALARRQGKTLFTVLLAGFDALLYRITGQRDVVVGAPEANRDRLETEALIGFFVNTLVLRTDLGGDPTMRALMTRVREGVLEAHAHRRLPFETMVAHLQPERTLSRTPLFQVLFAFQNIPAGGAADRVDVVPEPFPFERRDTLFDLSLNLDETPREIAGVFEYSTELFDRTRIQRLAGQFQTLLDAVIDDPQRRLSALPLLSAAERQQVTREWNDTAGASWDRPVHEILEARLDAFAETAAVVCGDRVVSYRELDRRAEDLARRLRRLGVAPDVRVAIGLRRSPATAVAVLGTLKAGGTCVPLDPAYPAERLAFMLRDAGAPVLLTDRASRDRFACRETRVIVLDPQTGGSSDPGRARADEREPVPAARTPATRLDHLMYVIYTSGSTGRPKGVALPHRCFANLVPWHLRTHLGGVRTAQFASLSFDVSFYEMFTCWLSGGTLVLIPEAARRDFGALARLLTTARVEKATFPVVVHEELARLAMAGGPRPRSLAELTSTGERLTVSDAMRAHLRARDDASFNNHYGPAETHVVTALRLARDSGRWDVHPSIGRPVASTRILILDRHLAPVPCGVTGELFIGGVQLARGYSARPGQTAERFVPDPSSDRPGARLYRSGDLARHLADGEIDYLGRVDHQVKIRGFRVEPAEIEAVLSGHPSVDEAVVASRDDGPAGRRLVAYVVARDEPPAAAELRGFLEERLPDYMIPAGFVRLPSLPLSPNGKLDRRALPAETGSDAPERAFVPPRDPLEETVAEVWASVLATATVGAHDNFFHLGGHSLLATRVISWLRQRCGVELALRELFEAPTVAGLARRVARAIKTGDAPSMPPIRRSKAPDRRRAPLSFAQKRLWFLDQLDPGTPAYNLPSAVRLAGELDPAALAASLTALARRHEALRTRFVLVDGEPEQRIDEPAPVALPVIDLAGLADKRRDELRRLVDAAARRRFDLARGPLLRATLARLDDDDHVLILVLHHIVSDGWSMDVLLRDLTLLYGALSRRGSAPATPTDLPLAPLPIQYADFARWQRRWLTGAVLDAQLDYWHRHLGAERSISELPADRPRSPIQTFRGARAVRPVPATTARRLRALARDEGATLFMVLLAGFKALFHRYAGGSSITVGTPVANRHRLEVEALIGCFVNTLVLKTDLTGAPTFRQLVARVRETTLAAYAHQDLPFERLVEALDPERDLSRTPLFQVLFQLQTPSLTARRAGVPRSPRLRSLPVDLGAAKFDLTVVLEALDDGLQAGVEYNPDLFHDTTVRRLLGHFLRLLENAAAAPEREIAALEILTAPEKSQMLIEWNAGGWTGAEPAARTLTQLFEARVARAPDAEALIVEGATGSPRRLSYRQLDRRANRLARRLRSLGVGPERLVGILLERSADLVTAILATLKAGGAYLPLDPAYPHDRLAFMLDDARASVVLTHRRFLELIGEPAAEVLVLDVAGAELAAHDAGPLTVTAAPDHPAYAIYTSGSTGQPKAVVITHRSAVAMVRWAGTVFDPAALSGVLASTSICFDLSVYELFVPLAYGGRVILAENALHLPSHPARETVTLINTVPSAAAELLAADGIPASVRTVNLAGEPLHRDLVEALHATGTVERVYNLYGPSEDTTYSTFARIDPGDPTAPLIGRPVAGSRAYVLDAGLRPRPLAAPGELALAGDGLARGYHRRAALTAERFVPDPFAAAPGGARLYRTGDRVRYRADGQLRFLGRFDHQVKLRGFRIELGEIEAALRRAPRVGDAVAAVLPVAGEPRLVAYVVAAGSPPPDDAPPEDVLRSALETRLPAHMVPSRIVFLDALPRTQNGKIDRRKLPVPEQVGRARAVYEPPRTATEQRIAGVWREVLGVERVGIDDNFFDLGGHSLLMVRACHRLRAAYEPPLALPLVRLFEHPTVAALARFLDRSLSPEPEPPASASSDRGSDRGLRRRQARARRRRRRATRDAEPRS